MKTEFQKMLLNKLDDFKERQRLKTIGKLHNDFDLPFPRFSKEEYEKMGGELVYGKPYCELYPLEVQADF